MKMMNMRIVSLKEKKNNAVISIDMFSDSENEESQKDSYNSEFNDSSKVTFCFICKYLKIDKYND